MKLPPLVLGAIAGVCGAALVTPFASGALVDLRAVRLERATLAAAAAAPPPARDIVVDGAALSAPGPGAAADLLATRLRAAATRGGLLVESATPVPAAGLARVRLRVSGAEDAVIAFADAHQRGTPIVRFARWSATGTAGGVTLDAEVVAPWR